MPRTQDQMASRKTPGETFRNSSSYTLARPGDNDVHVLEFYLPAITGP
jgi:hypothetical protein